MFSKRSVAAETSIPLGAVEGVIALFLHDLISPLTAISMGHELLKSGETEMLSVVSKATENMQAKTSFLRTLVTSNAPLSHKTFEELSTQYLKSHHDALFFCDKPSTPLTSLQYQSLMMVMVWILKNKGFVQELHIDLSSNKATLRAVAKNVAKKENEHLNRFLKTYLEKTGGTLVPSKHSSTIWELVF